MNDFGFKQVSKRQSLLSNDSMIKKTQSFWKSKFDQLLIEKKKWLDQVKGLNQNIQDLQDNKIKLESTLRHE